MMTTVARNRFLEHCERLLNSKPNKKGVRLQKTSYVGNYKAEVMTVTIERGDTLNVSENQIECVGYDKTYKHKGV